MVDTEVNNGFQINNSFGDVLSNSSWTVKPGTDFKVAVDALDSTSLRISTDAVLYFIANGELADFRALQQGHGFELRGQKRIFIQTLLAISGDTKVRVALLEYDAERRRIGEFFLDVNCIIDVTVNPDTEFVAFALRVQGIGQIAVHLLHAVTRESRNTNSTSQVIYRPGFVLTQTPSLEHIESHLAEIDKQLSKSRELPSASEEESVSSMQIDDDVYFSPSRIPASKILSKPSAHKAGRLAAIQKNSGDAAKVLADLLENRKTNFIRHIAFVGSKSFQASLETVGEVTAVLPGKEQAILDSKFSYLIIDENASNLGPWSGMLDAQGTNKFSSLHETIVKARSYGIVIVVAAGDTPSHFSSMLRKTADVVISSGIASHQWDRDIYLPVVRQLEKLTQERSIHG